MKQAISVCAGHQLTESTGSYDFPYDEVDEALAKDAPKRPFTPNEFDNPAQPDDAPLEALAATLWLVADQCIPEAPKPIHVHTVGARLLALLYIAHPDAFSGGSMKQLAERAGVTRQCLCEHVQRFRHAYGFRLAQSIPAGRRAKLTIAQRKSWAQRKEIERAAERENAKAERLPEKNEISTAQGIS